MRKSSKVGERSTKVLRSKRQWLCSSVTVPRERIEASIARHDAVQPVAWESVVSGARSTMYTSVRLQLNEIFSVTLTMPSLEKRR